MRSAERKGKGGSKELTEVTEDETKVTTYAYDFNSKLTDVSLPNGKKVSYSYDGLGNRTARTLTRPDGKTEATEYLNDLSNPLVQVLQATGDKETLTYPYGLQRISVTSERPGKQNPKPDTDYYLYDGLGSVKALVDSHGNQVAPYSYDEWGVPDPSTHFKGSGHPNTYGFTGEDWDPDTELLYLRARYYEPAAGRFNLKDSFAGLLVFPGTQNSYAYASNTPATYPDPSGHLPPTVVAALGNPVVLTALAITAIVLAELYLQSPQGQELGRETGQAVEGLIAWVRQAVPGAASATGEAAAAIYDFIGGQLQRGVPDWHIRFVNQYRWETSLGNPLPPTPNPKTPLEKVILALGVAATTLVWMVDPINSLARIYSNMNKDVRITSGNAW